MFDVRTVFGSGRLAVGGSRDLAGPGAAAFLVLAAAWQLAGRQIGMGCSVGADALALRGLVSPRLADVFAICSPVGSGAWSGTALADVLAAHRRGACVRWYAGGPPALDLSARLASRSRALGLHSAAGCLVAVSSPRSPGSLVLAGAVAARRLPVVALACGFPWYNLAPLAPGGYWRRLVSDGAVVAALWFSGK